MQFLSKNTEGNPDWPDSFIGQLCEDHVWDENEFWLLHAELTRFSQEQADSENLPRDIAAPFSRICYLTLLLYAAHCDKEDVFHITNISDERLGHFVERLEWLIRSFYESKFHKEESFYVRNPYLQDT